MKENSAKTTKSSRKFDEKLLSIDQFGQSFTMQIGEGKTALRSKLGAFCSFLLVIILIIYAGYKVSILEGKKNVDIIQAVKENHFDNDYVFGAE